MTTHKSGINQDAILYCVGALFFLALSLPVLITFIDGISLSGSIEETIGARYFYTLRNLYGNERPWVPQGHFIGLFHFVIQLALTALGHPPSELSPRVDIFTLVATMLPHLISAICFIWAVRPLQAASARLLVAVLALAIGYSSSLAAGIGVYAAWTQMIWWVMLPDYLAWTLPYAFVSIGVLLRMVRQPEYQVLTWRGALWLGLFTGLAVTTKVTFLVFPFAIVCLSLFFNPTWRTLKLLAIVAAPSAVLLAIAVLLVFYFGDVTAIKQQIVDLIRFMRAENDRMSAFDGHTRYDLRHWITVLTPNNRADILYFPVLTVVAIALTGLKRSHRFFLALVLPCLFSLQVAMHRFYFVTWTEVFFFHFAILVFWGACVFRLPPDADFAPNRSGRTATGLRLLLCAGLVWLVLPGALAKFSEIYNFSKAADVSSQKLTAQLQDLGGKTAFLIAKNNNYRPRTINSAICKGGIQWQNPVWGDSKYMVSTFPNEACFINQQPVDLASFNNAVTIRIKLAEDSREDVIRWTENFFSLSLAPFDCSRSVDFPDSEAIVCTRRAN